MAGEGEDQQKEEGKGFAGLSSLASDVDITSPTAGERAAATSHRDPPQVESPAGGQTAQQTPQQSYQAPTHPSSGSSLGKWILGFVALNCVFWFIGEANKKPADPTPTSGPAPSERATNGVRWDDPELWVPAKAQAASRPSTKPSAPASESVPKATETSGDKPWWADPAHYVPAQTKAPPRPTEALPPVGTNHIHSTAQIRYCLAEDIRMDGAKSTLNHYSDSDIDQFNAMVEDYNSRCSNFRYRVGSLENAREAIEPYRSQLQAEGRNRFGHGQSSRVPPKSASVDSNPFASFASTTARVRPTPDATVQAIQRILNARGYNAGPADGLMGQQTHVAILAFQRGSGLNPDAPTNVALLRLLQHGPIADEGNRSAAQRIPATEQSGDDGIPQNASLNYSGHGWDCNRGYYQAGKKCRTVQLPQNATLDYSGHGWDCNRGYYEAGKECRSVQVPQNASLDYSGHGWDCNRGYYEAGKECRSVQVPQNASLDYSGHGWDCDRGFRRAGAKCERI